MNARTVLTLTLSFVSTCFGDANRPVIGVLIQEYGPPNMSYIPASYVKFIEGGGARAVPIHINRSKDYYLNLLSQVNGVLFPGGDVDVATSGYAKAGKIIYDYAVERFKANDYFPLWGTCNGFEMLVYLSVNFNPLTICDAMNIPAPLNFSKHAQNSRLLGNLPEDVKIPLMELPTTANYHQNCLTMQNFTKYGVDKLFNVLSTNVDRNGLRYVSTIEAKDYPFYGVQFHPEKNIYEWPSKVGHSKIPHTKEGIRIGQYFAQFVVNESRKSKHNMTEETYAELAIYNFKPEFTNNSTTATFMQIYFFNE